MKKLIIYADGGSRGNPGPSAIGVVILNEKEQVLKKYSEYLGKKTNNEAEYEAVIFCLKKTKALFGKKKTQEMSLEIRSDSELLINQLNGKYKIIEPKIQELFLKVWNSKIGFKLVVFKLIPREENLEADKLVNEALDRELRTKKLF